MFDQVKTLMRRQFDALVANGPLFQVDIDRDKVWETYLRAIPEEFRLSNTCNYCKAFLRKYGGIVGIGPDNKMMTLWDFEIEDDEEYSAAIPALRRYVASLPITGLFFNEFAKCGTDKNLDKVRAVTWTHFAIELPKPFVKKEAEIGPLVGEKRESKNVLLRSINELTPDAVETVLELIGQDSLYRGAEFKGIVQQFQDIQKKARAIPAGLRENYCWIAASSAGAVTRIRNSAIGTLLIDLSEGKPLDDAVRAFERVVAPANYKRPTALVTPRMIDDAKARIAELGLTGSLQRRFLNDRDLTAANALHVFRKQTSGGDIFDQLKTDTLVNPRSLSKVDEIGIDDFIANVLPTAKTVRALVENTHLCNLVSLIGPVDPATPTLFKWGNNFSWSYAGEVADSIKERVKAAGGTVSGVLRISLSWHNHDDLDLHVIEPCGFEIYYGNKGHLSPSGGMLDVDMNAGIGTTREPVENIFWVREPANEGTYKAVVNQFCRRESQGDGFEVEMEYDGQLYSSASSANGATRKNHTVFEFEYSRKGGIKVKDVAGSLSKYPSKEKWGLKTGAFHTVKSITLSPNHWTNAIGNKHVFFLLEGAKNDDRGRPFYNEFLKEELSVDRKVFEILGAKINVEPTENELSGLGFSETLRNHLYIEVESTFKRTLKLKF